MTTDPTTLPTIGDIQQAKKDMTDINTFVVSEQNAFTDNQNKPRKTLTGIENEADNRISAAILEMNKSRGFRVVGTFADGFTYELFNDVGIDADGNSWIYVGVGAPNKIVAAGTVPSEPDYEQVTFNAAENIKFNDNTSVESFRSDVNLDLEELNKNVSTGRSGQYVYVDLTDASNPVVRIQYKYTPNEDRWVVLERAGLNGIFSFSSLRKNTHVQYDVRPRGKFEESTLVEKFETDLIGPIIMRADTNVTGTSSTAFTGGWHGFNGDQTGTPTASHKSITVYVDGRGVDASGVFEGYCDTLTIKSTSGIQGYNTKLADGSGREILDQEIYWSFKNGKAELHVRLIPKESITFVTYYGLQAAFVGTQGAYNNSTIWFVGGDNTVRNPASTTATSGAYTTYKCNRISLENSTGDMIQMWIDGDVGLGTRQYLAEGREGAFTGSIKSYFRLFSEVPFSTSAPIEFHGGYAWVKNGPPSPSKADATFELNRNGELWNVVDFISAGTEVDLSPPSDYFKIARPVESLIQDGTISDISNSWFFTTVTSSGAGEYWYKYK